MAVSKSILNLEEINSPSVEKTGDKTDKTENHDDLIEINVLGLFDEISIVNIENEFQDFYNNLQGNEVQWRGLVVGFYKNKTKNKFEINFKTQCKFEQVGNIRAEILDYIHELGGSMGEIQSITLESL